MRRADKEALEAKLAEIRKVSEEMHAILFDQFPEHARRFSKIAQYTGELATCLRVHDTLPEARRAPPLVEAAKVATRLHREVNNISRLIPKAKRP